ncbi:MAG: Phthiodiolone/phenolphthiodiolone dimycocerosates ketoreductase [Alphaproteobacteria bacterium MarineAlpha10_Bin3]|jgi:alkanesulfonate monooxygenase SsuD/methylene tetrahydromethanopterin reductase-like flavin-dependent oxidoreductase (luciferase family)|nr:MAG: Phthiodiolone/phenolphthiodiolone dimycocerosates ketoreductase [Alphaproteobacteria bacterium MarineAlpha10_Bin3]PPR75717.1 MAG: Phthiodiolone/phenolphthiodiolone dimycocerosates ketoreductase [Alphaproteobacteria bacterium MarineAlpha4_Bin1]
MKFGIFLATQWPEQASLEQEIGNLAAQVRAAKDCGFSSVWVGQHVLTRPLQMVQTVPLMARLAGDGEGMTFGSCITLLGMMNPVLVAEEAASLDWITGGNFVLGVGIGYRKEEFEALNVPFDDRVGRFEEAIPLIRRLWSQEWVTHKGAHFTVDNLGSSIQPVKDGSLPIWIGAQVPRAVRRAARMGDMWVPSPTPDYDVLEKYFRIYRDARRDAGLPLPEGQPLIRECFVGATRKAALRTARGPLLAKYQSYASWGEDGSAGASLADGFDEFMANRFIVADEAEAADQFARYGEQFGVEHMILRLQWPGLPQSDVIDCIERIGKIVARMR